MYKKCEDILRKLESEGKIKISNYQFPTKQELKLKLKDMLEDEVDEKYYLTDSMINYLENGKYQSSKVSNKLKQTETGISPTLDTMQGGNRQPFVNFKTRIRKLTPKECWRLMGFDDADFEKASQVNSNTQLYKQAGNSIVVNVLEAILTNLLKRSED